MKPALFRYVVPGSVSEVLDHLAGSDGGIKVLAGGQSLMPLMNFRIARFDCLVDINRVSELSYIHVCNSVVHIGALTRQRTIENSPIVATAVPLLWEATRLVAHLPIRSRGTIGGSLSHADPAAEYPAVMLALDASFVVRHAGGQRIIPARDFFQGIFATALEPHDLLVEIRLPAARPAQGFAFEEISRRRGDFAIVGVAAMIELEGSKIGQVRLAYCGIGERAARLFQSERLLETHAPDDDALEAAACKAAETVEPQRDIHADPDYRRHLLKVLTLRTLHRALANARTPAI